jgi:hypothetical protein
MDMKVTSIDQLKVMSGGEIVKLPPFIQGQDFYAKLRRPSMLKLVQSGQIPNSLLRTANMLFSGGVNEELDRDDEFMKDMFDVIDVLAGAVFVEPSWNDLKSAGIELTDEQYMFIFNYTQEGVKALEPFRENEENTAVSQHV